MEYGKKAFLAAAFGLVLLSPAVAAEAPMPSREVSYAGLDLTQPEATAELERRVSRAVRQVCRQAYGGSVVSTEAECRVAASRKAFADMTHAVQLAQARRATQLAAR